MEFCGLPPLHIAKGWISGLKVSAMAEIGICQQGRNMFQPSFCQKWSSRPYISVTIGD